MFSLRIVTTDHYLSAPIPGLDVQYADLRGSEVKKVPIVRIFGATPAGQKTCMHVHGVFPYLYVPYDGTAPWDRYLRQFSTSLDRALNVAQGYGQANIEHVYKIVLVSGRSMYGYHDKEQQYLKIYLYNPAMIKKAADLLLGGAVLNKPFQPHESHIPYTLQLFVDYNLYGMNMINIAAVKFRSRVDHDVIPGSQGSDEGPVQDSKTQSPLSYSLNRSGSITPSTRFWDQENIPSDLCIDVERQATCALEVDVVAADILNRQEVNVNVGANPGLKALWEDERERLRNRGLRTEDIAPPNSPGRVDVEMSDSEQMLQERLRQIILDLEPYMDSQSESDEEMSQQDVEVPSTPASLVHLHMSQAEDELADSQDTVVLDVDYGAAEPIVNMESIHRVVSASQSFRDVMPQLKPVDSHDTSLVDILAALADDNSEPTSSQEAASQAASLEEQDSVLSLTPRLRDPEVDGQEEAEILEMSQRIWDGDAGADIPEPHGADSAEQEYNLEGLDETWHDSQLEAATKADDDGDDDMSDADSDIIPQYDGAVDEQPTGHSKKHVTKRLGIHGPVANLAPGVAPQLNSVYGNRPNYPPMAQTGHQQQFNSQGYDNFQGFPNQNPPWEPVPRPPGMDQYPTPVNRAPWQPAQPWGGVGIPQQPPPGLQYSQPRPHAPAGQHMPAYRPRAGEFNKHTNPGYLQGRVAALERMPSLPPGPQHVAGMYHQPGIATEHPARDLQYPHLQGQENKAGYGQSGHAYNQVVSSQQMYPGGHHRSQIPGQVQNEPAQNVSPRASIGPHGDIIEPSGTVVRSYGTPVSANKLQGSCITSSEKSHISHMAIAASSERLHDNHMPGPTSSHMAHLSSSRMTTSRLSHMASSASSHMATTRSSQIATTGTSQMEISELANRSHINQTAALRSTDGIHRSQMMASVSTDVSHGGYMTAAADRLPDSQMSSPGFGDRSNVSHMVQPGLGNRAQGSQMTSPGSAEKAHGRHMALPGSSDRSFVSHMTSPTSVDRSYGGHMTLLGSPDRSHGSRMISPGSSDRGHGSHMASRGSADRSLGSHMASPGSADRSLGSHMASPGSADVSHASHMASRGSADRSLGSHMASQGSADISHSSHIASRGSADMSLGSHMASPGSADISHASHMMSPGSADRSHGSHMASPGSLPMQMGDPLSVAPPQPISISQTNPQMSPLSAMKLQSDHPVHQQTGYILKRPSSLCNKVQQDNIPQSRLLMTDDQAAYKMPASLTSTSSDDSFHARRICTEVNPHFSLASGGVRSMEMVPQQTTSQLQPPAGMGNGPNEGFPPGSISESCAIGPLGTRLQNNARLGTAESCSDHAQSSGHMINRYDSSGGLTSSPASNADSQSSNSYIIRRPQPFGISKTYPHPKPGEIDVPHSQQMFTPHYDAVTVYRQSSLEQYSPLLSPADKQNHHANVHAQVVDIDQKSAEMIKTHGDDGSNKTTMFQDIVQNLDPQQQAAFNRGRQSIRSANLTNTGSASQLECLTRGNQQNQALTSVAVNTGAGMNLNANQGSPRKGRGRPRKDSVQFNNVSKEINSMNPKSKSIVPLGDNFVGPISKYYAKNLGKIHSGSSEQTTTQSLSLSELSPVHSSHNSSSVSLPEKSSTALQKLLLDSNEQAISKSNAYKNASHSLSSSLATSEQYSNAINTGRSRTSSLASPVMGYFAGDALLRSPSNSSSNSSQLVEQNKLTFPHRLSLDSSTSRKDSSKGSDVSWNGSQEDLFADSSSSYVNNHLETPNVPTQKTDDNPASHVNTTTEDSSMMGTHSLRQQSLSPLTVISINSGRANQPLKPNLENDTLLSSLETFVGSVKKDEFEQYGVNFTTNDSSQFSNISAQTKPQTNITGNSFVSEQQGVRDLKQNSDMLLQESSQCTWTQLPNARLQMEKRQKRAYTKGNLAVRSLSLPEEAGKRKRGRPRKDSFVNDMGHTSHQPAHQFQLNQQVPQFVPNQPPLPENMYMQQQFTDPQQPSQIEPYSHTSYQNTQLNISQDYNGQPVQFNQYQLSEEIQSETHASQHIPPSRANAHVPELPNDSQFLENVQFSQQQSINAGDNQFRNMLQVQPFEMENFPPSSFLQELQSIDTENFHLQNRNSLPVYQNPVPVQNIATNQAHLPQMPQYQLSELLSIQRKVTSMPLPCKSYTYRFPISTPLFKQLKIKNKLSLEMDTVVEFVRMHPKDARRYSLLKIGQEVVKLVNLSEEKIEEAQNQLLDGIEVEAIPAPLRRIGITEHDQGTSISGTDGNVSMLRPNVCPHEVEDISDGTDLNVSKQRKFEVKDKNKVKSMFKNKNIANVPHLKKYRAGFPYFGKGHIGKKSARHFNPILGPDFEDDENIVLHDVNLTEASAGTLTPLKSRTPVAGRSPSHSAGNVMSDLDSHENKEYLDTKLKSLEPDENELCLNSQNNPQPDMFVSDIFEEKHEANPEEETGSDNEDEPEIENDKDSYAISSKTESRERDKGSVSITGTMKKDSMMDIHPVLNGFNNVPVVMGSVESDSTEANDEINKSLIPDKSKMEINISTASELPDKDMQYMSHVAEKENISIDTTHEVHEYECKSKKGIAENEERSAEVFFGKFKKHFEEKMAISKSYLSNDSKNLANTVMKPKTLNKISNRQSRSSSSESRTSVSTSRSNSRTKSSDILLLNENSKSSSESLELGQKSRNKRLSSLDKSDAGEIKRQKKSRSSTSSSKSGSRRGSRQNSSDRSKHKSKDGKNYYHIDRDSDGIPGVDYIVTGKFKGHKSMKVVLHRLEIGDSAESVNTSESNDLQSKNAVLRSKEDPIANKMDSDVVQHSDNPVPSSTGFSAEFEKFLSNMNNSQPENNQKNMSDEDECIDETDLYVKLKPDEAARNGPNDLKDFHDRSEMGIDKDLTHTSSALLEACDTESNSGMSRQVLTDSLDIGVTQGLSNKNVEYPTPKSSHTSVAHNMNCELLNAPSLTSASLNNECSIMADKDIDEVDHSVPGDIVRQTHDSSSADEYIQKKKSKKSKRKSHKDKKKRRHNRLSQAFVGKKRRKKHTSSKSSNSKLMTTLSVLHDATMENLSVNGPLTNFPISNISPFYIKDSSDHSSPVKSADVDLYADNVDDSNACYADTMYKLALFSPPDSEMGELTPPQPLSPDEIIQSMSNENSVIKAKSSENSSNIGLTEEKLTMADIKKSMHNTTIPLMGQEFYETPPASSVETIKSKENSPNSNVGCENIDTETDIGVIDKNISENKEVKTAVVKLAPLTLKDIQSICAEENENEAKKSLQDKAAVDDHLDNISPPDLGPPNIPRFSMRRDSSSSSAPPDLVQSQQSTGEFTVDSESNFDKLKRQCSESPRAIERNDLDRRPPPFLIPCRSPRVAASLSHSLSPRTAATDGEIKSYFSIPIDLNSKNRIGRSPGANSSSGSINIVKSEEFSDISDDDSENSNNSDDSRDEFSSDESVSCKNNNISGTDYKTNQGNTKSLESLKNNAMHTEIMPAKFDQEEKLKEIEEFEKRLKETDRNKGNMLSMFIEKQDFITNMNQEHNTNSLNVFKDLAQSTNMHENIYALNNKAPAVNLANRHSFMHVTGNCTEVDMFDNVNREQENIAANKHVGPIGSDIYQQKNIIGNSDHSFNVDQNSNVQNSGLNSQHVTGAHSRDLFESTAEDGVFSDISFKLGMNSGDLFESDQSHLLSSKGQINMQTHSSGISPPELLHSLSDSELRSDYMINRTSRFSDSVINSLAHHSLRKENDCYEGSYLSTSAGMQIGREVPVMVYGTGDGKQNINIGANPTGCTQQNTKQTTGAGDGSQQFTGREMGNNPHRPGMDRNSPGPYDQGTDVITPLTLPPSSESIKKSANLFGLSSVQAQDAYYSNPKDVIQRPREGGGQVLRVPSNMLKDLKEFEAAEKITGLKDWRAIFCVNESWYSQSNTKVLNDKLEKEPALKYALTGDSAVIISPCVLPPSRNSVEKWFDGRKLYKTLKNQAENKKGQELASCQNSDNLSIIKTNDQKNVSEDIEKPKYKTSGVRLNLFTGKREVFSTVQGTDIDSGESNRTEIEANDAMFHADTNQSFEIETTPKSTPDGDETAHLHSTPVARRMSTELFVPECTPIEGTSKRDVDMKDDQGAEFVTPKRIKPLRRLSTNTDAALRKAILTSQMKRQFCTPVQPTDTSQIEGQSPKNSFGFRVSQQNFQEAKALHEHQYLTVMGLELHVETRGDLRPDPEFDPIQAIFYSIYNDIPPESGTRHLTGVILIDPASADQPGHPNMSPDRARKLPSQSTPGPSRSRDSGTEVTDRHSPSRSTHSQKLQETLLQKSGISGVDVMYAKHEKDLFETFIQFMHRWDPDILVGYEIQMLSWGYLLERASSLGVGLAAAISRLPKAKSAGRHAAATEEFGADQMSEVHVAGRIVINLWRLLRHEVTLNVYTFENLAFHVLHRRVPLFSFRTLTAWYKHRTHLHRWKVIDHYVTRVKGCLDMMLQLDLIGRTSEFARVFGIEFYHVLSRGSQYRVESMMLRIAKPLNFIPESPSVHQRARMKAPECIPLTLEPQSRFYSDPVVVLDFQSLYPSIMIAYNYCFSTCLGRLDWLPKSHEGPIQFGCTSLNIPPSVLKKRERDLTISPNGVAFCTASVRKGVLPTMVEEILNTRLMVKKSMKGYRDDKTLTRLLHARQLGLKLIANVTYGYTAANFSGRMPCIEVGDSIVRKARETLERSIKLVRDTPEWGAQVIYGDTDSMFLLMKGRSKADAFRIGQEIADAVTAMFPKPIKLKFEKVYLPCALESKKRYVGYMYETPDQLEPVYDAKGIETVRRDSCAAVSKILERSIKILFEGRDVSAVKAYVQQQCQKVMEGTVGLQECIFAKEYRGMSGYKPGACVPSLNIAKKFLQQDRRAEPRVGERVPYVIVYGSPGLPLIQLVRSPRELLQDGSLRLNTTYYITKQILPPLHRLLSLLGVDVVTWYQEMPHVGPRGAAHSTLPQDARKGTISQYFSTSNCPVCDRQTKQKVCADCMADPQMVCVALTGRIMRWDRVRNQLARVCSACVGCMEPDTMKACTSLDCPILYRQSRAQRDFNRAEHLHAIIDKLF